MDQYLDDVVLFIMLVLPIVSIAVIGAVWMKLILESKSWDRMFENLYQGEIE
jgi:hypothetical protein